MTVTAPRPTEANRDALEIISCPPAYGVNYNAGYIGFTYTGSNIISTGIAYFGSSEKRKNDCAAVDLSISRR